MTLRERWGALGRRERILLVTAAVVAVFAGSRYLGGGWLDGLSTDEDDSWAQVQKIESYRKVVARAEAAERRAEELARRYEEAQVRLLTGSTPTEVGAELQGQLSSMASGAGLNVLSSQILREEEQDDGFLRVGVRLSLSGALEGVAGLLASIESGAIDMEVTLLEINRKLGASRRPVPGRSTPPAANVAPLTATMEIRTYMQAAL